MRPRTTQVAGAASLAAGGMVSDAFAGVAGGPAQASTLATLSEWLSATYAEAPALVLGLAVLLALPPLALLGRMLRRRASGSAGASDSTTRVYRRGDRLGRNVGLFDQAPQWPSTAWVEVDGGSRHTIGAGIVRLGRDDDNDICLPDKTVHRYHAAIHRTDDAQYLITDLSSSKGNGVLVNGLRVAEALLNDGDTIDLGQTKLRFAAQPA